MNGTNGMKEVMALKLLSRTSAVLALLALLVCVSLGHAQVGAARTQVANVIVVGNRNTPTEKIVQFIHTKPGMEYSFSLVQNDITRLADSRLFKHIRPRMETTTDGRVNIIFEVSEYPNIVREVIYRHAKHVDVKELEGLTRVQRGMPLDKELNQLACFQIEEHLKKKGYYFANVSLEEGHQENHDRVVFNITEGPTVRVRSINFVGHNELASASRLKTQIDSGAAVLESFGGVFQPEMINNDVIKLKEYYRSNGYLKANVARELHFSDDFRFVDVTFHIQEGIRYHVLDRAVDGPNKEELASVLLLKKGDPYNESIINADVRNLADYRGWRGHADEVRKFVSEVPDNPGMVKVQYLVEEKPQSYVGQVIIVGNTVTQDRVIRRVLGLYPGQTLRYPELRIAEKDLARINLFETNPELGIRPTVTALDSPGPFKDILVKVQEARTGSFMLGAGLNSNSGLVGNIVLNERNFDLFRLPTSWADFAEGTAFRGAGQELRIEAMPGTQFQRYTVSIREPFLFDQPISLLTSGYYRDRIFNEYTEGRFGGRVNIGHQLTKEWGISGGLRLENVNVSNVPYGAPVDYTSIVGNSLVVGPSVTAVWDTRDSFMRPTEGGKIEMSYEQIFGTYNFPLVNLEGSRYFTLWQRPDGSGKHVISAHSQVSYAGDNTPAFERYFGGGYLSLRGFQFRGVGPSVNGYQVGGQFMFLNSLEYQIPIRANDKLYFVTFLDTGTVESKVGISDYRVSAGFGLRIAIPMMGPVPIALDFGFPIVRAQSDQTQLFSFWVGMYR